MRVATDQVGFEMTHIEAKATNIGFGGHSENLSDVETVMSPEALALFSSLLAQMQSERDKPIETATNLVGPNAPSLDCKMTVSPGVPLGDNVTFGTKNFDGGSINLGEMENLTKLLVDAHQIVGDEAAKAALTSNARETTIFSDSPMVETSAVTNQLMQQAAIALIERKQLVDAVETSASRSAYESEALSHPQLAALLHAAIKLGQKKFEKQILSIAQTTTVTPASFPDFTTEIGSGSPPNISRDYIFSTFVQGPPQASGKMPVPMQLANLVHGPPQESGQGPAVPVMAKHLQGPPQASGQGPVGPAVMSKSLQSLPPPFPSHLAGADRHATTGGIVGNLTSGGEAAINEKTLGNFIKPEGDEKSKASIEGGVAMKSVRRLSDGLSKSRVEKPADAVMQSANRATVEAMSMANTNLVSSRTVTPAMMFDVARQMATDTSSENSNQSQQSASSSSSATPQQGGQPGGNAAGQQSRDAQTAIDSGKKNAGGERVAVYRLNVQQNGWADTMVRRLQTNLQNGTGSVRIILEPRNLGRLQVTMGLRDGRAFIRIAATTTQAATLLSESRAQLAQLFEQSGLRLTTMQTSAAIINGSGGDPADGGGSQMFADQQTAGQNANKDGKNSEHGNKLLSDSRNADDIEIDTTTALAPGETAVLNVLA